MIRNYCGYCNTSGSMKVCLKCNRTWCSKCYSTNKYPELPNYRVVGCPYCGCKQIETLR